MQVKTECKNCFFQKTIDGRQTGCNYHDRISKFLERNEAHLDAEGNYVVQRVCNSFVPKDFDNTKFKDFTKQVDKEISIRAHGLIISDNLTDIVLMVKKCIAESNFLNKISVIVSTISPTLVWNSVNDICSQYDVNFEVIHNLDSNIELQVSRTLEKVKAGYILFPGFESNNDILEKLNEQVNKKLEKVAYIIDDSSIAFHTKIMYTILQKILWQEKRNGSFSLHEFVENIKTEIDNYCNNMKTSLKIFEQPFVENTDLKNEYNNNNTT